MRRPWACMLVLPLAAGAVGAAASEPSPASDPPAALPAVSAAAAVTAPAAPEWIREVLPPGARPPDALPDASPVADPAAGAAAAAPGRLVERVERATPSGDAPERIEVEYTVDRALEAR